MNQAAFLRWRDILRWAEAVESESTGEKRELYRAKAYRARTICRVLWNELNERERNQVKNT